MLPGRLGAAATGAVLRGLGLCPQLACGGWPRNGDRVCVQSSWRWLVELRCLSSSSYRTADRWRARRRVRLAAAGVNPVRDLAAWSAVLWLSLPRRLVSRHLPTKEGSSTYVRSSRKARSRMPARSRRRDMRVLRPDQATDVPVVAAPKPPMKPLSSRHAPVSQVRTRSSLASAGLQDPPDHHPRSFRCHPPIATHQRSPASGRDRHSDRLCAGASWSSCAHGATAGHAGSVSFGAREGALAGTLAMMQKGMFGVRCEPRDAVS